ncbi:GntR family transcriptional regulator [Bacteriovorax stolpii]|nr:PLP-dependent aminotransferase family protein [Bacteriovorax stolpii]TDP55092.1 GntR family transcriptional regulator [Bacteriovorax stolpii]
METLDTSSDKNHLYIQIAERIKSWINEGTYLPGSKIPSMRQLSTKLDVSVSTVIQSYQLLERLGFIEARPQSGYYVKIRPLLQEAGIVTKPASAPRFVQTNNTFLDVIHACGDKSLAPLGAAVMHQDLLPTESLQRSLIKISRERAADCINYEIGAGNWQLRQELAKRSIEMGCDISPESINVTTGCMEAINLALKAVTKPGDIVAVESPTYHGHINALENLGLKALEIATSSQSGMDLDALEEKISKFDVKAVLVTPSFSNPLGSLMSDESKQKMVSLCSKYNVHIVEDDIYGELQFEGNRPLALKSFDKKDIVMYCSSFSKTLAPGYRIGWVIPPAKFFDKIEIMKFSNTVSPNSAAQIALADHLKNNNYDRHLRKLRQTLSQNMHLFSHKIIECFPEGTKITTPSGGCLIWVEFPKGINALELHEKALKHKISLIPGPLFSVTGKYENCIRINTGTLWNSNIEAALEKIGKLAHALAKK